MCTVLSFDAVRSGCWLEEVDDRQFGKRLHIDDWPDVEVERDLVTIRGDDDTPLPRRPPGPESFLYTGRQGRLETGSRHVAEVVAGDALRGLQEPARAAVHENDVHRRVHDDTGGGVALPQDRPDELSRIERVMFALGHVRALRVEGPHRSGRQVEDEIARVCNWLATENFPFLVGHPKAFGCRADGLRGAQQQQALWQEAVVEEREDLFLKFGGEIDEDVSTGNQIELGKWRILDQALRRKNEHLSNRLADPIAPVLLEVEVPLETVRCQVCPDIGGIPPGARCLDGTLVDVRAENLDMEVMRQLRHDLVEQNRDRVRFLTAAAGGHPDADLLVGGFGGQLRQQMLLCQGLESGRVSEKARHADQQLPEEGVGLALRGL